MECYVHTHKKHVAFTQKLYTAFSAF